jgi:cation:H+ antiporter
LILGMSALIAPLVVSRQLIRVDVPLMIAVSILSYLLALDGGFGVADGLLLVSGLIAYTLWSIRAGRRAQLTVNQELKAAEERGVGQTMANVILIAGGLLLLGMGSECLVRGAVSIARVLGISELVIGLTIVAVGTSLPEASASIVAALRGERDIAVGNVVGSNLFNLLGVLGLASILAPGGFAVSPAALKFDLPVMIAVAAVCLPVFFAGGQILRWEGGMCLAFYAAYLTDLILRSVESPSAPNFRLLVVFLMVPVGAMALSLSVIRSFAKANQAEYAPGESSP